jgi:hypothetical protein
MTDLVKRLRFGVALDEQGGVSWCSQEVMFNAADRIEKLETALRQLIHGMETDIWMSDGDIIEIARKALEP